MQKDACSKLGRHHNPLSKLWTTSIWHLSWQIGMHVTLLQPPKQRKINVGFLLKTSCFFTYALFLSIPHNNWKLLVQKQRINLSYSFCFQHEIMPNFFHRRLNSTIADNIITNFMFKYRSRTVKLLMEHLRKVNAVLWILSWKLYDIKRKN